MMHPSPESDQPIQPAPKSDQHTQSPQSTPSAVAPAAPPATPAGAKPGQDAIDKSASPAVDDFKLLLTVIGAIWVAFQVNTNFVIYLNALRDQVLLGKVGGEAIETAHHHWLLFFDWCGNAFVYTLVNSFFGVVIFTAPKAIRSANKHFNWTCWILGGWLVFGTVIPFCLGMILEGPVLYNAVATAEAAKAAQAANPSPASGAPTPDSP